MVLTSARQVARSSASLIRGLNDEEGAEALGKGWDVGVVADVTAGDQLRKGVFTVRKRGFRRSRQQMGGAGFGDECCR